MTTGQLIRAARKNAGMTQAELAQKLGISYVGISQWENDLRNPKYETIQRLAAALGVEWTELVPEEQQGQQVIDHIRGKLAKIGLEANIAPDDEEILKDLLPHMSELEPLTDEETALKTLLNPMGYDILKTRGNYFFTYESGGSEISKDDVIELLNCAQNGLKVAAKTLELKLIQKVLVSFQRHQDTPQSAPSASAGTDTASPGSLPEGAEAPLKSEEIDWGPPRGEEVW